MLTYSPGQWHLVVSPGTVALLAPEVPDSTLMDVWQAMRRRTGLAAVLDGLVGAFGTSLSALPAFIVATMEDSEGDARVVARGTVIARIESDNGTEQISGHGVTTWTEKTVPRAGRIELVAVADQPAQLPLADGVASAASAVWVVDDSSVSHPPTEAISVAVPTPGEPAPEEPAPDVAAPTAEADTDVTVTQVPEFTLTGGDAELDAPREDLTEDPGDGDPISDDTVAPATQTPPSETASSVQEPTASGGVIDGIPRSVSARVSTAASPAVSAPAEPEPVSVQGDHDGETISAAQLAQLRKDRKLPEHGGEPESGAVETPVRPAATLVVSTGDRVVLDRSAVVGRRPKAVRATGTVPHLVMVPSPNQDISRNHVELRVEGTDICAVDLDSVNGTLLRRDGADPQRLHPGEVTLLVSGDQLDVGDGVVLSFEGL